MNNKTENPVSNWYQIADFIRRKKDFICIYALLSGISFVLSAIYSLQNPAAGEAFAYNLTLISGVMTLGLVGVCAAAGIGFAAFFSALLLGWSIQKVAHERRMLALSNRVPEFDGQSDHLFVIGPGDNREKIEQLQGIESGLQDGVIVGLLQYRQPLITVIHKKKGIERGQISRADLLPDFSGRDFANETAQTFGEYASRARNEFAAYCANVRLQLPGATLYDLASSGLKTSYAIIALLLFALPAFAQTKTERVNMGLGAAAQTVPKKGVLVSYTFSKNTITRYGDGINTVSGLINSDGRAGSDADNMGELTGVDIAGLAIKAVPQTKQPQPEKPKPLFQSRIESAVPVLPDSVQFKQQLTRLDQMVQDMIDVGFANSVAIYASKTFYYGIHFLLYFTILCQFISNSAVNESRLSFYGGVKYGKGIYKVGAGARFFAWIGWIVCAVIFLIYVFYCLSVENGIGGIFAMIFSVNTLKLAFAIAITYGIERIADKFLKNPKTEAGFPDHGGNGGNYPTKR